MFALPHSASILHQADSVKMEYEIQALAAALPDIILV